MSSAPCLVFLKKPSKTLPERNHPAGPSLLNRKAFAGFSFRSRAAIAKRKKWSPQRHPGASLARAGRMAAAGFML